MMLDMEKKLVEKVSALSLVVFDKCPPLQGIVETLHFIQSLQNTYKSCNRKFDEKSPRPFWVLLINKLPNCPLGNFVKLLWRETGKCFVKCCGRFLASSYGDSIVYDYGNRELKTFDPPAFNVGRSSRWPASMFGHFIVSISFVRPVWMFGLCPRVTWSGLVRAPAQHRGHPVLPESWNDTD